MRKQAQGRRVEFDAFLVQDVVEVANDVARRHLLQVELQAARQHGDRDLLRIGGGQNELDVLGRLFQRLQHGVERVVGQHVHFVDHVDLEAGIGRRIDRLLQQLRHFVDAAVGGRVHFDVVDKASGIDGHASLAHAAGGGGNAAVAIRADAVERLGQDTGERGLAHAAGAGEQVGVVQPLLFQRMRQRAHDVLLAYQGVETAGTVFAGENLIGHDNGCGRLFGSGGHFILFRRRHRL